MLTKNELQIFLANHRIYFGGDRWLYDWVKCNDGFVFSVQASDFHRSHIKDGVITHYEVGFPSTPPKYIDMNGDDIAEFVDADYVVGEINYHGGIAYDEYQMDV